MVEALTGLSMDLVETTARRCASPQAHPPALLVALLLAWRPALVGPPRLAGRAAAWCGSPPSASSARTCSWLRRPGLLRQAGFLAVGAYAFRPLRIGRRPFSSRSSSPGRRPARWAGWWASPRSGSRGRTWPFATLGFGTAVYQTFANVEVLSGGPRGLAIPQLQPPLGLPRDVWVFCVYFALFLAFTAVAYNLVSSSWAAPSVAVRDSDIAAEAWGEPGALQAAGLRRVVVYTGVQAPSWPSTWATSSRSPSTSRRPWTFFVAVIVGGWPPSRARSSGRLRHPGAGALRRLPVGGTGPLRLGILAVLIFEPLGLGRGVAEDPLLLPLWPFR